MALPLLPLLVLGGAAAWALSRRPTKPAAALPPALPPPPIPVMAPAERKTEAERVLTEFAMDPGMPADLAEGVAAALAKEKDPSKLDAWANQVETLGFTRSATALRAKAASLRALQGAARALEQIDAIQKDEVPPTPAPEITEVREKARETVEKAAEVAEQRPDLENAAAKAAEAAAAAAKAAATQDPAKVTEAAQKAAEAAAAVVSPVAQAKAADAVQAATEAVAVPTVENIAKAADAAIEAGKQAMTDATKVYPGGTPTFEEAPPPAPPAPIAPPVAPPPVAPVAPVVDPALAALATQVANEVRTKGCWKEDRSIVSDFQRRVYPEAGSIDGMYGPRVALTLNKYTAKVPAPCYWPSGTTDRAKAKAEWADLVATAQVNVGRGLGRARLTL